MIGIFSLSKKHHQHLMFYQLESASVSVTEFSTPQKNPVLIVEDCRKRTYKHLHTLCKTGMEEQIIPQDNLSGRVVGC